MQASMTFPGLATPQLTTPQLTTQKLATAKPVTLRLASVPDAAPSAISIVTPTPVVPASPDGSRITLRARSDAWVQVRDRSGPVLLNRVMRSGETWAVPAKGQLLLTTGNAGGTELLVDGCVHQPVQFGEPDA